MRVLTILCAGGWMPGHISEGWRRLGWEVEEFLYGTHMGRDWTAAGTRENRELNRRLRETAGRLAAGGGLDLIFAMVYDDVLSIETARAMRGLGVPMVNYHVDLVGQWYRVLRTGRYFDRVACAQRAHWEDLSRAGIRPWYMPMAANPPAPWEDAEGEAFDGVLYLGSPWPYRRRVLERIAAAGVPLRVHGNNWGDPGETGGTAGAWKKTLHDVAHYLVPRARGEGAGRILEVARRRLRRREPADRELPAGVVRGPYADADFGPLVRGAAINLGFTHFSGTGRGGDIRRQVRLRDFEIPMAGGFYLTEECPQLLELFRPGRDLAVWRDEDDLVAKIEHYLAAPGERRAIAEAGRRHCLDHHTWEHRFRGLLEELGIGRAPNPPAPAAAR